MTRFRARWANLLCALVVFGCATTREPTLKTPTGNHTPAELVANDWTQGGGVYMMRQTALFEFGGTKSVMDGMVRWNRENGIVRLVALNEMGVKLFDVTVTDDTETVHLMVPELARYGDVGRTVARCVRKVFLDPHPGPEDTFSRNLYTYELARENLEGLLVFVFDGEGRMIAKRFAGDLEKYGVTYADYARTVAGLVPSNALFEDPQSGFSLSLSIRSLKKVE